jgi:putative multiple sugar transport system permease protein
MTTRSQVKQTTFLSNLQRVLGQNIRQYGMFIALFVIMIIFFDHD